MIKSSAFNRHVLVEVLTRTVLVSAPHVPVPPPGNGQVIHLPRLRRNPTRDESLRHKPSSQESLMTPKLYHRIFQRHQVDSRAGIFKNTARGVQFSHTGARVSRGNGRRSWSNCRVPLSGVIFSGASGDLRAQSGPEPLVLPRIDSAHGPQETSLTSRHGRGVVWCGKNCYLDARTPPPRRTERY